MAEKTSRYNEDNLPNNPPPYSSSPPGAYIPLYPTAPPPRPYPQVPEEYSQSPGPYGPGVTQTTLIPVVVAQQMGPQSTRTTCRSCQKEISSRIETKPSTKTHLFALGLCLLGLWCCFCIPYCVDSCMTTEHYCPNCNAFLGKYNS